MTGGVAKNRGVKALSEKLGVSPVAFGAADPQLAGALGAALIAADFAPAQAGGSRSGGDDPT